MYGYAKKLTDFDCFIIVYIPKEIRKLTGNINIITKIYRIQVYDLIMWGNFCIGFIGFMLKGKSLLEYTNLFSPNDKIILKYFP